MNRPRSKTAMPRLVLLTGAILLMADYAFAQYTPDPMQCQQIRQAAAQYGYAASRQHALEAYGPEAVKAGDKCFTRHTKRITISHVPRKGRFLRSAGIK